jgi:hypothetical protein
VFRRNKSVDFILRTVPFFKWYILVVLLHKLPRTTQRFLRFGVSVYVQVIIRPTYYLKHVMFMNDCVVFFLWRRDPTRVMASSFLRFLDHIRRRTAVGRTPLNEWSARHRDLCLTTHSTHNRQTSMPPVEFEPTISASERPQTYALNHAATGTSVCFLFTCSK